MEGHYLPPKHPTLHRWEIGTFMLKIQTTAGPPLHFLRYSGCSWHYNNCTTIQIWGVTFLQLIEILLIGTTINIARLHKKR